MKNETGIAFLGLCERVAYVPDGNTVLYKWNIVGLKSIILSYIFPMNISGFYAAIALHSDYASNHIHFSITEKETGTHIGQIDINLVKHIIQYNDQLIEVSRLGDGVIFYTDEGWTLLFFSLKDINIIVRCPGYYYFNVVQDQRKTVVGLLEFTLIDPPPLNSERIAAITSDPNANKEVRMEIVCKQCPSKFKLYAALESNERLEQDGYISYNFIPDEFLCDCANTRLDLRILRRNFHGLLGTRRRDSDNLNHIPLYERSSLEHIRNRFAHLLNSKPGEERLQQFIQSNTVLLHQFPAEKIFFKPPILTYYKADFSIVTPQKELILIEIEDTTTRLLTKKGEVAAPLNHAFEQVRSWFHVIDEHRLAVLDCMGIDYQRVSMIRGVVIAGRDTGYDAHHLRRLRGRNWGGISFLTYDDLLFALDGLIRTIEIL